MQSSTVTLTSAPVVVTLREKPREFSEDDLNQKIRELREILLKETTSECEDPLSLKIKEVTLLLALSSESYKVVLAALNRLMSDPLTRKPFQNPIIDDDWVWEKSYFQEAKEIDIPSPYTGRPLGEGHDHLLLQDLVRWSQSFPVSLFPELKGSHVYDWNKPSDACRLTHIGRNWARVREEEAEVLEIERDVNIFLDEMKKSEARCEEDLKQHEESLKKHELHLVGLLAQLKGDQEELVGIFTEENDYLKSQISDLRNRQDTLKARIRELEVTIARGSEHINSLYARIESLKGGGGGRNCIVM